MGDRRLQAFSNFRWAVRKVRLSEADQGRQGQDLRSERGETLRRRRERQTQRAPGRRPEQVETSLSRPRRRFGECGVRLGPGGRIEMTARQGDRETRRWVSAQAIPGW